MRGAIGLVLAALLLVAAGCRTDVREVRVDLTQVARLIRVYASAAPSAPAAPDAERLSPERLNDLGVMLERRGMLEPAQRHYRMAVERKPSFARAWVNLGNVARREGHHDEALEYYRRAMQQDPELFEAVNNFADLCADTGRCVEEALGMLRPALERAPPEQGAGRDTLGKLLLRVGRYAEAARAFRDALDVTDPRDTELAIEVLLHLGQACRALGDEDAARSAELRAAALR